jgi:hypothetical protein
LLEDSAIQIREKLTRLLCSRKTKKGVLQMGIRITRNRDRDLSVETDGPEYSIAQERIHRENGFWNYAMREANVDSVSGDSTSEIKEKLSEKARERGHDEVEGVLRYVW